MTYTPRVSDIHTYLSTINNYGVHLVDSHFNSTSPNWPSKRDFCHGKVSVNLVYAHMTLYNTGMCYSTRTICVYIIIMCGKYTL